MKQMPAGEFKAQCLAIMDKVQKTGEPVLITKHGKPIARLVPIGRSDPDRRREAVRALLEFAKGHTLGVPVKQLIEEGRR